MQRIKNNISMRPAKIFFVIIGLTMILLINGCMPKVTLRPFASDGCSMFPDRSPILKKDWYECCYEHDLAYWRGGTEEEREKADRILRDCIIKKTNNFHLAELMYKGVRIGGSPYFPTWYRWGYGWNYMRGYKTFTQEEKKLIQIRLQEFQKEMKKTICDSLP